MPVVRPSKEATVEQVLAWASHHAQARKEQPLIDAVKEARAMGDKFLLDGRRLYNRAPAHLKEMLPGDIGAAWLVLWGDWRDAIDATATCPSNPDSDAGLHAAMQQAWSVMMKPLVKVKTLAQLKACTDNIAYMDRKSGVQIYAMPQGLTWPLADDGSRFLHVRPCWLPLWAAVQQQENNGSPGAILSGTPGIGRSFFANFLLLRRAQEAAQTGSKTVLHSGDKRTVITFVGGRVESALTRQLWPRLVRRTTSTSPKPWIIHDPPHDTGGGCGTHPGAFVVITASPSTHYKALMYRGGAMLYMAPWSLQELQAVRLFMGSKALSVTEVKRRFGQFGGVPRYIFTGEAAYQHWLRKLNKQIKECDPFWVAQQMRNAAIVPSEKHILFHYTVADTESPNTIKVKLASPYVRKRVLGAALTLSLWELREAVGASRIPGNCNKAV